MKILTRHGEVSLSKRDLAAYDFAGRRQVATAKRKKQIQVENGIAYFTVGAKVNLPHEIVNLLRALVNLEYHDKAWAAETTTPEYEDAHHSTTRGHVLNLDVQFNLKTGELTLDNRISLRGPAPPKKTLKSLARVQRDMHKIPKTTAKVRGR